jgi:DNA-binding NtrC family response regulator
MSVLIVEDEAPVRALLLEVLSTHHPCVAVETAEEALVLLSKQKFDVLLTDISLPGMSGVQLVRRVYDLHPNVCVIVMSGAPVEASHGWSALGVYAYLLKPLDLSEVERCVAGAMQLSLNRHGRHDKRSE